MRVYKTSHSNAISLETENKVELSIVIPARDEAAVLEDSLRTLEGRLNGCDQVHVIADHCRDTTAAIAVKAGAQVHIRAEGKLTGKGPALHWWLEKTHGDVPPDQVVVVLDADSRVAPNFFEVVREHFARGAFAAQVPVEPVIPQKSVVALLAAHSEIVEQHVYDALRGRWGWPVRLRGTGMAFRRDVLEQMSPFLHTCVEDVELSLLLTSAQIPISHIPETSVRDPKPGDQIGSIRQRARWLKGQFQVIRSYPSRIMRLLIMGPKGWSLIGSVLLKPKTLFFPIKLGIFVWAAFMAVGLHSGWPLWAAFSLLSVASILVDCTALLYGLRYSPHKWATLVALAVSPVYLLLWLRSLAMAVVSRGPWLRSRRDPIIKPMSETGSAG